MRQDESRLLEDLYRTYLVPLKKAAVGIGVAYDDIEDLVHETMLCYYDNYPLDWNNKQKRAMLGRILYSKWVDQYRKNSHLAGVSIDNSDDAGIVLRKLMEKDTLSYVIDNEVYREIRAIINDLKKDWRDVLLLNIVADMPVKEICELLEIRETVCRTRISRAKKELRERIRKSGIMDP